MKLTFLKYSLLRNLLSEIKHIPSFQIILLFIWLLINYFLGNILYGIFVLLLFITCIKIKSAQCIFRITIFIFVFLHLPVIETIHQIRNINLHAVQYPWQTLSFVLTPGSGQEVLPFEVQEMVSLIDKHQLPDYRLSKQLDKNLLIHQRMLEAAWPSKMDVSTSPLIHSLDLSDINLPLPLDHTVSSYLFISVNERNIAEDDPEFTLIDKREKVALVYCH